MSTTPLQSKTGSLSAVTGRSVTAPFRPQTYRNLVYLGLQFPLGLTYFVLLVPVLAFGLGTLPVVALLGLPLLGSLLLGIALMTVDRTVTDLLLPVDLDRHAASRSVDDGVVGYVKELLLDPGTYLSLGFVLTKFVIGIVSFVALTVSGSFVAVMVTAPLFYARLGVTYTIPDPRVVSTVADGGFVTGSLTYSGTVVVIDTLPEALGLAAVGVILLFVSLNLLNASAWLLGRLTLLTCRHARVFAPGARDTVDESSHE